MSGLMYVCCTNLALCSISDEKTKHLHIRHANLFESIQNMGSNDLVTTNQETESKRAASPSSGFGWLSKQ